MITGLKFLKDPKNNQTNLLQEHNSMALNKTMVEV